MLFEQILFFLAAAGAIAGALGVVVLRNPFFSVLALVGHLLALAVLFLLLRAEFVAAAQVVVYAGAVMVLYVFVVAYIGGIEEPLGPSAGPLRVLGPAFAGVLLIEIAIATIGSGLRAVSSAGPAVAEGFGSTEAIGALLLQKFLVAFEFASFLLLVAAVAAVVLAQRRRGLEEAGGALPFQVGRRPEGGPQSEDPAVAGTGGPSGQPVEERTPTVAQES
ncbi:MAG: NADH-quinone oxidoreductase subunit J [Actinomycetota bacterium]|nr:NADH-quinone oxidoreductase subunit J [Actinomycetota bacterium]